jgi:hypothetical protein
MQRNIIMNKAHRDVLVTCLNPLSYVQWSGL